MKIGLWSAAAIGGLLLISAHGAAAQATAGQPDAAAPTAPAATPAAVPAATPAAPPAAAGPLRAPAGTPILVEITQGVSSKSAKRGDTFTLRLSAPIVVDGRVVLAEGAVGVGEVIDAAHPGMGGTEGKLVLAGRYLDVNGQHVSIRGLKVGGGGHNNAHLAMAVGMATYGVGGLFITGGNIDVPAGTIAQAKLGVDYPATDAAAAAPAAPASAPAAPAAAPAPAQPATAAKPADQGTPK